MATNEETSVERIKRREPDGIHRKEMQGINT